MELSDLEFEEFCYALLTRERPGAPISLGGGSKDFGADIIDASQGGTLYQCKRYRGTVGLREIRSELENLLINRHGDKIPDAKKIVFLISSKISTPAQRLLMSSNVWGQVLERLHISGKAEADELLRFAEAWNPELECEIGVSLSARAVAFPDLVQTFFFAQPMITGDAGALIQAISSMFQPARRRTSSAKLPGRFPSKQRGTFHYASGGAISSEAVSLPDSVTVTQQCERLLVVGNGGAGKSLLLERLHDRQSDAAVLIDLADFDGWTEAGLALSLAGFIRSLARGQQPQGEPRLLLIDGVDQLRTEFVADLAPALGDHERWIVAARRLGDIPSDLLLHVGGVLELAPLDDAELENLIVEETDLNPGHVIALLRSSGALEICRTPLFARATINLLKANSPVSGSRMQILEAIVKMTLPLHAGLEATEAVDSAPDTFLTSLAYVLTKRGTVSLRPPDVAALLGYWPEKLISELTEAHILGAGRRVRFIHQWFQEYFAARALLLAVRAGRPPEEFAENLPWWTIGWWHEPARLAAEREPDHIVNWLASTRALAAAEIAATLSVPLATRARAAILSCAKSHLAEQNPIGAVYALRLIDAYSEQSRPGAGVSADGLPDIEWLACGEKLRIAKFPITVAQFAAFSEQADADCQSESGELGSYPAIFVSWHQAREFCEWLSRRLGAEVRLPTVIEWERAAGFPALEYPWGRWRAGACNVRIAGFGGRTPVGAFPLGNALGTGAADMSGNVWEWCADALEQRRAAKGGSWASYAHHAASMFTHWLVPDEQLDEVGFRPVVQI